MFNIDTDSIGLPEVQAFLKVWIGGASYLLVVLLGAELLLRTSEWWNAKREGRDKKLLPNDAIVNMLTSSVYTLTLQGLGFGAIFAAGFWGYNHSHWRIPLNWWTVVPYILAGDFLFYFSHRMMHEIRFFWADHAVHHSSEEFDFSTFQRFHIFEWAPKVITFTWLSMMGFHPMVLFLFSTLTAVQLICHTARFGRWGWWDKFFCSPTIHGVHHARNPLYMDRNLGGATSFWDHVFGTYQNATEEKLIYGVTHSPKSTNIIKVLFWEYTFLWRDFIHAPTLKDKIVVLFGRPGETFEVPWPQAGKREETAAPEPAQIAAAA